VTWLRLRFRSFRRRSGLQLARGDEREAALFGLSSVSFAADPTRLLSVKGMTCPACSAKVEHALRQVPGVKTAQVDFKSGQATVIADRQVKSAQLVDAVIESGLSDRGRDARAGIGRG
jgi:copper chaperone CopZ